MAYLIREMEMICRKTLKKWACLLWGLPLSGHAHPLNWPDQALGFWGGLLHPLSSLEHVAIMLTIGLVLYQGVRVLFYIAPLVFSILMLLGGALAFADIEVVIAESIMAFALLILALEFKSAWVIGLALMANFAVLHGYRHGYDMLLDTDAVAFTTGFTVATALLMVAGMLVRMQLNRVWRHYFPRRLLGAG